MRLIAAASLLMLVAVSVVLARPDGGAAAAPPTRTIEIPLENGVLDADALLAAILREAGVSESPGTGWRIDLNDPAMRDRLDSIASATGGAVSFDAGDAALTVTLDARRIEAVAARIEAQLRGAIERTVAPPVGAGASPTAPRHYGIGFATPADPWMAVGELPAVPRRAVVLVHGFDDPGWTWGDMIPALQAQGHVVARFEYPNDGPITAAANRFGAELEALRAAGVERIDIVAHSMGGLVARDVLTRGAWYGGDGRGGDRLPTVERLVMMGTPNQGARMAHLAQLSETKDQLVRMLLGEGRLGAKPDDGGGEAAAQLMPGSSFIRDLNGRPLASHVAHTVIAGRMVEPSNGVTSWIGRASAALVEAQPEQADSIRAAASQLAGLVAQASAELGDGLVRIEEARLEGVDDMVIVEGNHHGIVARWKASDPEPPAIEIVIDRLGREPAED